MTHKVVPHAPDSRPRPRKCPTCKQRFRPTRRGMIYCSEPCFRKAWRKKDRKLRKHRPPLDPTINTDLMLEAGICLYCGGSFWANAGKGAKYCKPGCRTMANRVRRAATIAAFCQHSGKSHDQALDFAELAGGMKAMRAFLMKKGFVYSESSRAWV